MKNSALRNYVLLVTTIVTLIAANAQAAPKYWDIDGAIPGAGGATPSGIWTNAPNTNWTADATGSIDATSWTPGDIAIFSAGSDASGAYTITGTAGLTPAAITNEDGTVTLAGTAIGMATGTITVKSGAVLAIPGSSQLTASAGASMVLDGGTIRNTATGTGGSFINAAMVITLTASGGTIAHTVSNILSIVQTGTPGNIISGSGSLTKAGAGVLAIATPCSYGGSTTVTAGELRIRNLANRLPITTHVTVSGATSSGGILNVNSVVTGGAIGQQIASLSGDGRVGLGSSCLLISNDVGTTTFSGSISNVANHGAAGTTSAGGRVAKWGASTQIFGGPNRFTGSYTNHEGTTIVSLGGALMDPTGDLVINGGTLTFSNVAQTVLSLSHNTATTGSLELSSGHTLTVNPTSGTRTYSGTIIGAGALTKSGGVSGVLALGGANTYDGATTISVGAIRASHSSALGSTVGSSSIASGAMIEISGSGLSIPENFSSVAGTGTNATAGAIRNLANNNGLSGTIALGAATLINSDAGTLTLSGAISGTGALTKSGAGALALTGGNSQVGTVTVSAGTLSINSDSSLGDVGNALSLGAGTTLESTAGLTLNAGRTLTLAGAATISPTSGTLTIGQAITTGGGLTKTGAGTLTLGGANTYTGGTTVSAGTLRVNGSIAGNVSVASGATVGGTGTIGGTVTLSGTEAPGASIGTLNSAAQTFAGGASFEMEIDDATGTSGTSPGWDRTSISGASVGGLNITATSANPLTIKIVSLSGGSPGDIANFTDTSTYTWTIVATTEGITNFAANAFVFDKSYFSNSTGLYGTFRVITNNGGNDLAVEYYQQDPNITDQPDSRTNNYGTEATFSVAANSSTTAYYQWRKGGVDLTDGGNITGATTASLTVGTVAYTDAGAFDVYITNTVSAVTSVVANLTVIDPIITSQPVSITNCANQEAAVFSVSASGSASIVYQWRRNGVDLTDGGSISGATSSSLMISPLNATNAGTYDVKVAGTASLQTNTSTTAVLTVIDPPTITFAPVSRTVQAGVNVGFVVAASGTAPLSYQWAVNGVDQSGATTTSFTRSNVVAGSETISVAVTNASEPHACVGASASATLTVTAGNIRLYETNLVVLRKGNGVQTLVGTGNSVFLDQYTTGGVYVSTTTIPDNGASQLVMQGVSTTEGCIMLSTNGRQICIAGYNTNLSNTLGLGTANGIERAAAMVNALSVYQRPFTSVALTTSQIRSAQGDGNGNFWTSAGGSGTFYGTSPSTITLIQSAKTNTRIIRMFNNKLYLSCASSAGTPAYQGLLITNLVTSAVAQFETVSNILGAATGVGNGINDFAVSPDSSIIYFTDDNGGIALQRWDLSGGVYNKTYNITNGLVVAGVGATRYMTVDWSGPSPVIYATSSSSSSNLLMRVVDTDATAAFVTIAQAGPNQVFSGVTFGPLAEAPTVSAASPAASTNCEGSTVTFSVSSTGGTAPIYYQWQKNGADLANGGVVSGATTASLTLTGIAAADAASYACVLTNDIGSITSAPGVLTVVVAATVTTDPTGGAFADGATINLTVVAGGTAPITYQWRKNGVDLTDGGIVSGATTDSLTIGPANAADSGSYEAVVSNVCGSDTSAVAVVTVACPTITLSPPSLPNTIQFNIYSQTVSASGGSASPYTFAVTVGTLPAGLTLASGGGISGAATTFGTNDFTIEATDTNGCTGSNAYTIIVTPATVDTNLPTVTISTPANNSGHTATPVAFTGTAADPGAGASGVLEVRFGVNGGPTNNVATGTTAWTASVPVDPGTNTVYFVSKDNQANESLAKSRKVFLSVPGIFSLGTNVAAPYGFIKTYTVTGDTTTTNGAPLKIGRAYTVEAYPAAVSNHLFTNWTVVVNGGSPTVVTNLKYTFLMNSNVSLTANFITNNFIGAAGFYYGLFNDVGVAHQSAGWFKIKTDSKQKFSGKILVQGEVVAVSGTFNQSGHGVLKPGKVFARKGLTNAPIVVELDLALDGSDVLTGTVSNNVEGWNSTLLGDRGTFAYITAPATNYMIGGTTGQFTFVYAGSLTAATEPGGDGYALVTLKSNGFVTPTGGRAGDYQLRKSTTTSISKNGQWPFYAPMYKYSAARTSPAFTAKTYRGSVFGWLTFTNNTVIGDLYWNKIDWTNGIYDSGFTNTETIIGSGYIKPPSLTPVFADTNGTTMLADGNIPASPLINDWTLSSNNKLFFTNAVPPINTNGIKGSVATGKGEVSVTFTNPATPLSKTTAKGVVLQDINEIRGVFVGTNQTGSIRLTP